MRKPLLELGSCRLLQALLVCLASALCTANTAALDVVKIMPPEADHDIRFSYKRLVLEAALNATVESHGPYEIQQMFGYMSHARAMRELSRKEGLINVAYAIPTYEREQYAIPVRIPVRKGLLSYRLLLVKKERAEEFQSIKTIDELKEKRLGSGVTWITTKVFRDRGWPVATNEDRKGLLNMLERERFDYILFGVNEIFKELDQHNLSERGLVVAPDVGVFLKMPLYMFVARNEPEIAERLEVGMKRIVASGQLDTLFNDYYLKDIHRADLNSRHFIEINNNFLPATVPSSSSRYWLDPTKPKYHKGAAK